MEVIEIDTDSWWYKNCKRNRENKAKCCQECPFKDYIKQFEQR